MSASVQSAPAASGTLNDAAAVVAALEAKSTRHETPCGKGSMVWRRWGDGPPVLLLHGGAGAWSHWIRNIGPLLERHTVWVPDLPGLGDSAMPEVLSIDAVVEIVANGFMSLVPGDTPVDVVGFSFGGAVGSGVGVRLGKRLRNLVLAASRFTLDRNHSFPRLVSWKEIEDPVARLEGHRRNLEIMMIAHPENIDALALYIQSTNAPRSRFYGPKLNPGGKLHEYLPQVTPQMRITGISGLQDQVAHSVMGLQDAGLKAIHPTGIFHGLDGAGHWVQYEAADRFNAILADTLASRK